MIVDLSDSENPSSGSSKRKTPSSVSVDRRRGLARSKLAELESLMKSIVSLFTLPQKFEEKSLTVFLKSKLKIKESLLNKSLDNLRKTIMKSLEEGSKFYDPLVGEKYIDYLLSIYVSIQKKMCRVEGDESTSVYNFPEAKKDLVEKNRAKDEAIKIKIQEIVIDSLSVASTKISSYTFVKSLLNAFDQFMK